jgi:hypothetical protein
MFRTLYNRKDPQLPAWKEAVRIEDSVWRGRKETNLHHLLEYNRVL